MSYLGCTLLIRALLYTYAPNRLLPGLVAFAWNPLVLLETHAMAHNDLYMVFFVLLALWYWLHERYAAVLIALTLGTLVKYVPLLCLPPTLVLLWRRLPPGRRQPLFTGTLISLALVGALFTPLWPGWESWALLGQMRRGHGSIGVWLTLVLARLVPMVRAFNISTLVMRIAFLASYGVIVGRALFRSTPLAVIYYRLWMSWITLGAMSFGYWYVTWPLALIPLVPRRGVWARTIALSWTGLMSVALYTFGGYWLAWGNASMSLIVIPFVFATPFLLEQSFRRQRPLADRLDRVIAFHRVLGDTNSSR